jgi:hypothetical protein
MCRLRTEQWISSSFKKGRGKAADGDEDEEGADEGPPSPRVGGVASGRFGAKGVGKGSVKGKALPSKGKGRFADDEEEEEDGEKGKPDSAVLLKLVCGTIWFLTGGWWGWPHNYFCGSGRRGGVEVLV